MANIEWIQFIKQMRAEYISAQIMYEKHKSNKHTNRSQIPWLSTKKKCMELQIVSKSMPQAPIEYAALNNSSNGNVIENMG